MKMQAALALGVFALWAVVICASLWIRNYTVLGIVTTVMLSVMGFYFSKQLNGKKG